MAQANVTIVDIDPDGDVLIEEHRGSTKPLVSSKVLAQASDFKTMMDHFEQFIRDHIALSRLTHGQRWKGHSEDLCTLPLPLLDREASILFLKVLHHQTKEIPEKLSLELVLDIGFSCSMVRCANALKP